MHLCLAVDEEERGAEAEKHQRSNQENIVSYDQRTRLVKQVGWGVVVGETLRPLLMSDVAVDMRLPKGIKHSDGERGS